MINSKNYIIKYYHYGFDYVIMFDHFLSTFSDVIMFIIILRYFFVNIFLYISCYLCRPFFIFIENMTHLCSIRQYNDIFSQYPLY
jgi:hypothetical protein